MKISIAIPTRSRAIFLQKCLQSVLLAAETAKCPVEVIVSDNASDDNTREIVAGFESNRIIYHRLEQRISMRQNFESALSLTTGTHVIFIGDDDGIVPNGLRILENLIETYQSEIYSWRTLNFKWPNDETQIPGHLVIRPMKLSGRIRQIAPEKIAARFFSGKYGSYQDGGMIYHGCVSRKLIDRVRNRCQGTYFWCSSPDVFSSIANVLTTQMPILKVDRPISIGGASPRSNGDSGVKAAQTGKQEDSKEYARFIRESRNDPFNSRASDQCSSISLHTLYALELACQLQDVPFQINKKNWMARIKKEIAAFSPNMIPPCEENLNLVFNTDIRIQATGKAAVPDMAEVLESQVKKMADAPVSIKHSLSRSTISGGKHMCDIAEAARFLDDLAGNDDLQQAMHPPAAMTGILRIRRKLRQLG